MGETNKVYFVIEGSFITNTARSWYWEERRSYSVVRNLLVNSMVSDEISDEVIDQCIRELLFYKGKLIGRTDDDSYSYKDEPDEIPERIQKLIEENNFENPLEYAFDEELEFFDDEEDFDSEYAEEFIDSFLNSEDDDDDNDYFEDDEEEYFEDDEEEEDDPLERAKASLSFVRKTPTHRVPDSRFPRVLKHFSFDKYVNVADLDNPRWVEKVEEATKFEAGFHGTNNLNNIIYWLSGNMRFNMTHVIELDSESVDFVLSPLGEIRYVTYMSHEAVKKSIGEPFSNQWVSGHRSQIANNVPMSREEVELFRDEYFLTKPEKLTEAQVATLKLEYALGNMSKSVMIKLGLEKE
jgi:DNA-directed RNA polymerase subunit delta